MKTKITNKFSKLRSISSVEVINSIRVLKLQLFNYSAFYLGCIYGDKELKFLLHQDIYKF